MLVTRIPQLVAAALLTAVRSLDAVVGAGSIENAREALVGGRRQRMLQGLLEDLEKAPVPTEVRPAASST